LIVVGAVAAEVKFSAIWPKWLLLIGDSSYSLYLIHPLTLVLVEKLLAHTGIFKPNGAVWQGEMLVIVICVFASLMLGFITYYVLEKPLIGIFRKVWPDQRNRLVVRAHEAL
jgi:peptidoglycan/LPS O-acetylase OafA/YrhL